MNWVARVRFLHRAWRYRLRSEKFGISFLLGRDLAGKTAVDIGANRGIYSYWLHRRVGSEGRVVAFEPQPELAAHLRTLRDLYPLPRLEVAERGLSSEPGELTLLRPRRHWGAASFETAWRDEGDVETLRVPVTTLDDYLASSPARPVAFVKCDVEGHEHRVLEGGRRILAEDRPELLFECHDADNPRCATFALLRELDYEGFCFFDRGFAPLSEYAALRPRIHRRALVDFVFVPRERAHAFAARGGDGSIKKTPVARSAARPEAAVARAEAA